ncbi:hypothetical protein A2865_03850 [Candidatus Woesebacteria bacterium RIFCSPHIGHO2_01_FULL_39_17]|uniref:Uncharacterized protein n=2 Tax=Candidatus Woeseibacteriota TaxID=1752722 RepID=A0A0G0NMW3_9BACT|nr:MAG: hypothetical protein US72_C0001G0033 [Microgenomates group bacterium GW2011_GWC1_38_12]KKR14116.1 MAG: hypothetical protein UT40_C0005G0045 [Candidatus Woesebacteria bacterium GW2011_GWA1_39_21b]OGM23561.1 MAG: hypothetical protein A2865_03850 [Candidatus Woesebacteria bacterium RIFCSPHIGHO2_01_FULL_39_17]OGM63006.1 MAG: hypothetical protein A3A52_03380 [Candidatus Woesebacteria bacterium RIFCSPLOWO2_01_FULL_39_14]
MRKPKAPHLVTVAIFTTITTIFWIFFSLYRILATESLPKVDPKLLEPLNPELDREALNLLEERVYFEETDITKPFFVPLLPIPTGISEEPPPEETVEESTESANTPI